MRNSYGKADSLYIKRKPHCTLILIWDFGYSPKNICKNICNTCIDIHIYLHKSSSPESEISRFGHIRKHDKIAVLCFN